MKRRMVFAVILAVALLLGMTQVLARGGDVKDSYFTDKRIYPTGNTYEVGGRIKKGNLSQSAQAQVTNYVHVDDGQNRLVYQVFRYDGPAGTQGLYMSRTGTVTMPYLSGRASLTTYYLTVSSLSGSKNAYFITGRWNADNLGT